MVPSVNWWQIHCVLRIHQDALVRTLGFDLWRTLRLLCFGPGFIARTVAETSTEKCAVLLSLPGQASLDRPSQPLEALLPLLPGLDRGAYNWSLQMHRC